MKVVQFEQTWLYAIQYGENLSKDARDHAGYVI